MGPWLHGVGLARDPRAAGVVAFLDAALAWGTLAAFTPFRTRHRSLQTAVLAFAAAVHRPRELLQAWRNADAAFASRVRAFVAGEDPAGDAAALARLAAEAADPEVRLLASLIAAGIPPWHASALERRLERSGPDWLDRWLAMQARRPPLWLRVAEPRHTAAVRDMLATDGLRTLQQDGAALAVVGATPVFRTRAWKEGKVEIQDLASQRVGDAVPAGPGQFLWDACAGTGGKAMQLWARLGGRGAVHASDAAPPRLAELRKRLQRVDARNIRIWSWDGRGPPVLASEVDRRGGFDAVLLDAPCSGSGTWRRRPDARLRSVASALPRWAAQQGILLAAASGAVRPGGALVYATCSVWEAENEAVIEAFLKANPAWELERQAFTGAPDLDADTLFFAVLRAQGATAPPRSHLA